MSLQSIKEKGFTIVELLIVIVVIGVLAAIVIVAYTGITQNANTSQAQSNANAVAKVAEVMNADTGNYPTTATALTAGSTTSKLPSGVTIVRPAGANIGALRTAVANTAGTAGTFIPAGNYSTIGVAYVTGNGGGVVFYRTGAGAIGEVFYGGAGTGSAFTQLGA